MGRIRIEYKDKNKKTKRRQYLILLIMVLVLLLALVSFAWYYFKIDREADTTEAKIMGPYYLYLWDENANSLQLTIGSMHPGETKSVIIGVSNKPAKDSTESNLKENSSAFIYELELAYTQNLPVEYSVFELEESIAGAYQIYDLLGKPILLDKQTASQSGTNALSKSEEESANRTTAYNKELYGDEISGKEDIVNYVQYDVYAQDSNGEDFQMASFLAESDNYEVDYYLVELQWEDNIKFQDYIKETDLIYLSARTK